MNPNDHTEMYWDGYNDALNGHSINSNPYSLKRNRLSYERGHRAGQKELTRRASARASASGRLAFDSAPVTV